MTPSSLRFIALASLLTAPLGCSPHEPEEKRLPVDIAFAARVGAEPFACGRLYTGLGTTATTYEPMDFRLYLHDVRLVSEDGTEVPVALTDDGQWQHDGALLLDFADKSGLCTNGTEATHTRLTGTVPEGKYRGLRFKLGLPESLNHQDVSTAPAPFNDIGLFWSWRFGYLFTRIEGRTAGLRSGHFMHLGSTDCPVLVPGQASEGCTFVNRPEVVLEGFSLNSSTVVLDLAGLFTGSNLDVDANVPNTAIGCMSQQEDPDCAPMFQRLGLAFGNQPADPSAQAFIRLEPSAP